ncbi:unnamed protein product [Cuscuta campestris]|uniref:CCHC-type domain-containing protein n=1 Tax=Cuscuta campestris TaxID=132261 RepID=A0A484N3C6_9ASTE|nr:unnamed protein product [Cuscuta campestris]
MRIYIRSTNFQLWLVMKNGEEIPMKKVGETTAPKTENEFDAEDIKKIENYAKAINMRYCAANPDDYRKISCCTTAKEMWDKLEVTYEGTDQVRETKIDFLTQEYEMFRMKEGEKIDDMFDRFSKIINDLHALKKTYTNKDLRKGRKHDGPPKCYGCGEIGHIKPRCPKAKHGKDKPGFKKQKAYISWGGDSGDESTDQEEDEAANLCLMAHEDQNDDVQENSALQLQNSAVPTAMSPVEHRCSEFSTMGKDKSRAATFGKSKSKSRAPATSSEERLYYGNGSYLWFDSKEERTRFLTFFSKQVVAPPRIVLERFPELQGYDNLDAQLHQAGLWPFVSRARKEINQALIRAFYSNLWHENDVLYSLVKSKPIELSVEQLGRIAGLPFQGDDVSHYGRHLPFKRIGEGQSTSRPPLFDGTNYSYWKERMRIYIRSTNFQLWLVMKNGEEIPMKKVGETTAPKTENEFDAEDIKKIENYAKAINMRYCAVNPDDYRKISCCTTAKEMWDKLEVTYEGTDQVRETKIDFLTQEYEMFRMKEDVEMFQKEFLEKEIIMLRIVELLLFHDATYAPCKVPFQRQSLLKFISLKYDFYFFNLICKIYLNLHITLGDSPILISHVDGKTIQVDAKTLTAILGLRQGGVCGNFDGTFVDKAIWQNLSVPFHRLSYANSSNPSVTNLTLTQQVLQYIFCDVLLPRDSSHGVVNKDDIHLLHVLLNDVKINCVNFFFVALRDGSRLHHLHFAVPIMLILLRCKVDFSRDIRVPVKKTCFIQEMKLTRFICGNDGEMPQPRATAIEQDASIHESQAETEAMPSRTGEGPSNAGEGSSNVGEETSRSVPLLFSAVLRGPSKKNSSPFSAVLFRSTP